MNKQEQPQTVISDFDGTITDSNQEAATYKDAYTASLAQKIGLSTIELTSFLDTAKKEILANPGVYGWEYNGLIVAPALADPYLFHQSAAKKALEYLRKTSRTLHLSVEEQNQLLIELHAESYRQTGTFFKQGARNFVTDLNEKSNFFIVTNSETDLVKKKLHLLLGTIENTVQVLGNAKKYKIDQVWEEVQRSIQPPGFPRPVYLRRKAYAEVMKKIGSIDIVIGDIYELDLALPEAMGVFTILITSSSTPSWERDYYEDHSNGMSSDSLEAIAYSLLASHL